MCPPSAFCFHLPSQPVEWTRLFLPPLAQASGPGYKLWMQTYGTILRVPALRQLLVASVPAIALGRKPQRFGQPSQA